jgi:hypothetical protein
VNEIEQRITSKKQYKAAIATLPKPQGARERTTAEIVARLNPQERHEVQRILRSMTLRKTIRRILYESFHGLRPSTQLNSMQRLRAAVHTQQQNAKSQSDSNERLQIFTPHVTEAPRIIT